MDEAVYFTVLPHAQTIEEVFKELGFLYGGAGTELRALRVIGFWCPATVHGRIDGPPAHSWSQLRAASILCPKIRFFPTENSALLEV